MIELLALYESHLRARASACREWARCFRSTDLAREYETIANNYVGDADSIAREIARQHMQRPRATK